MNDKASLLGMSCRTAINTLLKCSAFIIALTVFVLGLADSARAGTLIFGPESFQRGSGKPEKVSKSFAVNNPSGTFWLQISNGSGGQNLVSSAVIQLNGQQVASPQDFNQQVLGFSKDVTLQPTNTLEVELRSSPGSFLTIEIRQADPTPTVTNGNKDLSGINNGDFVALWWEKDDRASEYAFFRGPTSDGPWEEVTRVPLSNGVDFTSEARLRQLCYRVEALDASGGIVRRYTPICLPQFVQAFATPTKKFANAVQRDYSESLRPFSVVPCPRDVIFEQALPNSIFQTLVMGGPGDLDIFVRDCCIRDDVVEIYVDNCLLATVDSRGGEVGTHQGETHTISLEAGTHTIEYRNVISGVGPSGWEICETVKTFTGSFSCGKPYNTMCLSDQQFVDANAMNTDQIRTFLADRNSFLRGDLADVDGVIINPAQIIQSAAQAQAINPEVILTMMQKESGAVTAQIRLSPNTLRLIMGFGGPSTIRNQINSATAQLRRDFDRLVNDQPTAGGWRVGVTKMSLDPLAVTPAKKGVAVLFSYNPYVGQGWGGKKGVGGNFLFCSVWAKFGF